MGAGGAASAESTVAAAAVLEPRSRGRLMLEKCRLDARGQGSGLCALNAPCPSLLRSGAMKIAIVLSSLLSIFATTVPNLCDDVFLDPLGQPLTDGVGQTLSRYCAWTGPDAPVWDADVCCAFDDDGAACSVPLAVGCPTGTTRMYCEHGKANALGGVTCYQPLPDACEAGMCIEAPEMPPDVQKSELIMCCSPGGICQHIAWGDWSSDCQGEILWCPYGWVDASGLAECWG